MVGGRRIGEFNFFSSIPHAFSIPLLEIKNEEMAGQFFFFSHPLLLQHSFFLILGIEKGGEESDPISVYVF